MKKLISLFCAFLTIGIFAQTSLVKNVPLKNIGPTVMSGRVVDLDVNPEKPHEFYVAYASGGLWYTDDNGISFTPVADNAPTQNMGDIAVDWKNGTIWIGTGESNSSRSSYAGIGILKSTDKGKTWTNVGLKDSQHTGRVVINANNPEEVVVGAVGNLYSSSKERGIFKTTDGGKTWENTLFINEDTGVIDVKASPTNPNVLYAATWERQREAWNFKGNGKGSAIYKSSDGGSTWTKISGNGFPTDDGVGRIGLAVFNDDVVYALLDNQARKPKKDNKKKNDDGLKKDDFKTITKEAFLKLDNKKLDQFLRSNRFEKKYTASSVKDLVKKDKAKPADLAIYLEDANALLFSSPIIGAELYKTTDGGKSWVKTHKDIIEDLYYTYGYYFGTIAVNEANQNKVYLGGVPLLMSEDGGKTFKSISKSNVHSDHQALWVNPKLDGHIVNGNDGGVNITFNDGEKWTKNNSTSVGQFYTVNVDNKKPYNVYGGLQDNGVWYGPSTYQASNSWQGSGQYPYKMIGGGDGMQVQIDSRNNDLIYTGLQFGNYYRINLKTKERLTINPKHQLGDSPYRYNWQTPILLSPHNQDILYMGANKLLRSMNQGEDFEAISDDLTTGGKKGNVPYGTLTSISESPFQFGMIYAGSDDGYINLTKDGGATWQRISDNLPQKLWVSRVIASEHEKGRVYATLNGYRFDDFKPYVFVSDDYGTTWKNINSNLPDAPVNVIKEDPVDENILYLGTDNALYVSFDKGGNWQLLSNGLPKVAVHDLVIQKEAKDLVVGTHGRSIYKTNIASLQQYNKVKNKPISIFKLPKTKFSPSWGRSWSKWGKPFEPKVTIPFYAANAGKYTVTILDKNELTINSFTTDADAGFNYFDYDFSVNEKNLKKLDKKGFKSRKAQNGVYYLPKGEYTVKMTSGKNSASKKLIVE